MLHYTPHSTPFGPKKDPLSDSTHLGHICLPGTNTQREDCSPKNAAGKCSSGLARVCAKSWALQGFWIWPSLLNMGCRLWALQNLSRLRLSVGRLCTSARPEASRAILSSSRCGAGFATRGPRRLCSNAAMISRH